MKTVENLMSSRKGNGQDSVDFALTPEVTQKLPHRQQFVVPKGGPNK